jgi:hypothetical protein
MQSGTIKIRKLNYDTLSHEETLVDSTSQYIYQDRYDKKNKSNKLEEIKDPKFKGCINDYVILKGNKIYVFNTPISEKDQELSRSKMSSKFWKKMKRLKKRNQIHFFKVACNTKWIDSINSEFENDYVVYDVYHDEDKIAKRVKKIKIPGTEKITDNEKKYARYIILNDTFMVLTSNTFSNRNQMWTLDVLINLNSNLLQSDDNSIFNLHLTCNKSIDYHTYEIIFDLKNSGKNEVKIIRDETEEFICTYTIKKKNIYIDNPPIPEFAKGKINSKISKIKFKIHSTNHVYSMKKK